MKSLMKIVYPSTSEKMLITNKGAPKTVPSKTAPLGKSVPEKKLTMKKSKGKTSESNSVDDDKKEKEENAALRMLVQRLDGEKNIATNQVADLTKSLSMAVESLADANDHIEKLNVSILRLEHDNINGTQQIAELNKTLDVERSRFAVGCPEVVRSWSTFGCLYPEYDVADSLEENQV